MELNLAIVIVGKIRIDRRKEIEKQKIKKRKTEEAGVDYEK